MEFFYAGFYTRPEKVTQHLKCFTLILIAGGFEYMRFTGENKTLLKPPVEIDEENPYLLLIPPGITLDFSCGEKRENYVVMLDLPELEYEPNLLQSRYNSVPLTPVVRLTAQQVRFMRGIFAGAVENISSGKTVGREKAKLQLSLFFAELMETHESPESRSPAASAMKEAIDQDIRFQFSIRELNERLGYCSLPYMRKLFFAEYGILPGKYRNVRRMNRIMELFAKSDFSLKMIADEAGMKNLSHLYAFLRNEQTLSPKELMLRIRGRKN